MNEESKFPIMEERIMDDVFAEEKTGWISVTERLPEEHKDVLVAGVEAIGGGRVYSVKVWDGDRWRPESAPSVWWKAWMPLPGIYEAEKGANNETQRHFRQNPRKSK